MPELHETVRACENLLDKLLRKYGTVDLSVAAPRKIAPRVQGPHRTYTSPAERDQIVYLYQTNQCTVGEIAQRFNRSPSCISSIIKGRHKYNAQKSNMGTTFNRTTFAEWKKANTPAANAAA